MVRVTVKNLQKKVSLRQREIKKIISKVLQSEKKGIKGEINVSFVNDPLIRKLNKKYLKKDSPTDVLAFNIGDIKEKTKLYADILISADTALRNAKIFKTTPDYELKLYSVHGILHLLGYDDHSLKDKKIIRKKELKYVHP
ncbi:MAG TPA: rRNA maturation RNase YbeY [Candidatus Omnitrophota bacterium]|jgi:probable rRNA maturation factor|nr:rRNA maturation RNase YbeY [Candidatus Omnitrophota bacterium]